MYEGNKTNSGFYVCVIWMSSIREGEQEVDSREIMHNICKGLDSFKSIFIYNISEIRAVSVDKYDSKP